jgi:hypothetical protein
MNWRMSGGGQVGVIGVENVKAPDLRGLSHAAEWSRTITGVSTHKALNLARLPVPPQPLEGRSILDVPAQR